MRPYSLAAVRKHPSGMQEPVLLKLRTNWYFFEPKVTLEHKETSLKIKKSLIYSNTLKAKKVSMNQQFK